MTTKLYNLSMLFERPDDLPAVWCVHVLDFDVITQGDNLEHALSMALEASAMVVQWDTQAGKDPLDRRADDADWDRFRQLQLHGHPVANFAAIDEKNLQSLGLQGMAMFVWPPVQATSTRRHGRPARSEPQTPPATFREPVAWPQSHAVM